MMQFDRETCLENCKNLKYRFIITVTYMAKTFFIIRKLTVSKLTSSIIRLSTF